MRPPLYALLNNAGTLNSHTNDHQLPAGCGCSQSLLVRPFDSAELVSKLSWGHCHIQTLVSEILATRYSHLSL